jgi:hypothetical protein
LHPGAPCGSLSSMKTTNAALRHPLQEEGEEDQPMKHVQKVQTPRLTPLLERLYRAGHLRLATGDLASLGLPEPRPVKMSLTQALMLDRGEGPLVR